MGRKCETDRLPAEPLRKWIQGEIEKASLREDTSGRKNGAPVKYVATRLGVSDRLVYRWARSLDHNGTGTIDSYPAATIEDALERYGVFVWEVFPDIYEDIEICDRYCRTCGEHVTTGPDHICPWCENNTREPLMKATTVTA